ncbi:hypothetical protein D9619_007913 [Psilocybe cf. subviscida]|uniref:Aminoglycoside phosphotransferase domain-containing protein n=1 Tax=Psilocybe cf. subviscida TaxID=2480587 RepID=A0A8H5ATR3_9AGAR|nr:hypothetical protein D9619_007913 [Psilocybe cf. subviscida]
MGQSLSLHLELPSEEDRHSSIDTFTDEDIYTAIDNRRTEDAIGFRADKLLRRDAIVHPISHDAVFKHVLDPEIFTMSYVASHTSIPIPRVRRVLVPRSSATLKFEKWVVMDRIEGEPLETAWPTMSWWSRIRIILYMRNYIRQLHSIPIPYPDKPGPFDGDGCLHRCWGLFFTTYGAGPFESYKEMADWYDRRRFDAMVLHHQSTNRILQCPKFDRTQSLVVCHMDLNMRNILIDRKGIPWVIDWEQAGAFPPWLEYAQAAIWFGPYVPAFRHVPLLWKWTTSFMFGSYGKYLHDYLYKIGDLIWCTDPHDYPLDYFSDIGIDVD